MNQKINCKISYYGVVYKVWREKFKSEVDLKSFWRKKKTLKLWSCKCGLHFAQTGGSFSSAESMHWDMMVPTLCTLSSMAARSRVERPSLSSMYAHKGWADNFFIPFPDSFMEGQFCSHNSSSSRQASILLDSPELAIPRWLRARRALSAQLLQQGEVGRIPPSCWAYNKVKELAFGHPWQNLGGQALLQGEELCSSKWNTSSDLLSDARWDRRFTSPPMVLCATCNPLILGHLLKQEGIHIKAKQICCFFWATHNIKTMAASCKYFICLPKWTR